MNEFSDLEKEWFIALAEWCLDEGTRYRDIIRVKMDRVHEFLDIENVEVFQKWLKSLHQNNLIWVDDWVKFPFNEYHFELQPEGLILYDDFVLPPARDKEPKNDKMVLVRDINPKLYRHLRYLKYQSKKETSKEEFKTILNGLKANNPTLNLQELGAKMDRIITKRLDNAKT